MGIDEHRRFAPDPLERARNATRGNASCANQAEEAERCGRRQAGVRDAPGGAETEPKPRRRVNHRLQANSFDARTGSKSADTRSEPPVSAVKEPELERQGRVLGASGWRFVLIGLLLALPGAALVIFTHGLVMAIGIVILALSGCPVVVGTGLLLSSLVARRSARHKLFA